MRCSRRALWTGSLACASVLVTMETPCEANVNVTDLDAGAPNEPVAGGAPSFKEALGLSGSLRAADFSRNKSFSAGTGYAVGSIWATARPRELWGIRTYFDARMQEQDFLRLSGISWDLREAHAQMTFGDFDIRGGRQITVWGRADKVNPTDVWSTRDFTLLVSNDEDQRVGVSALQGAWNKGAYRVIGLWQPEWRYPVLPIPPLPARITVRNVAPTDSTRQFGFKLDHSGEDLDWSVSYSHSIDRTPDLKVLAAGAQGAPLGLVYRKLNVVGADGALPIGRYGLRGEVAYIRPQDQDGTDPLTKNRNVFAVLGCERTFDGVLNINVQYLYRRTFDFVVPSSISNPNTRLLAEQVDLLSNQLAPDMHGTSLRINYKTWNDTLESELAAVVWLTKRDLVLRPKVAYAFSDRFKGIIGAEIYHGPAASFFGRLSPTSTAYAEVQIGF